MGTFQIQGVTLVAHESDRETAELRISSSPRPYTVTFQSGAGAGSRLAQDILRHAAPLLLVDKNLYALYMKDQAEIAHVPRFELDVNEGIKNIHSVLEIVDFLERNNASKSSMLFAVGGGIVQDLAAFASYMYKRGIPWTFVPTTLLAQGDSSVGGKTALNHKETKNLLALFSAPRRIITDTGFLSTLPDEDWYSGAGEIFRLCVTGGDRSLQELERLAPALLQHDLARTTDLIRTALTVKKAVVEHDEFELDIRRSMNYGHSFGHALEALANYRIAHGVGVTIGMLVENEISYLRGTLGLEERNRLLQLGSQLISTSSWGIFQSLSLNGILDLLKRDKKTEGAVLKLATLKRIGQIEFIDLRMDSQGEAEVKAAATSVIQAIGERRNA
jgi:3-dehydroquinate synthase